MSDITTSSFGKDYCGSSKCDTGSNSMLMILLLLFLCGGDNGIFGGCGTGGSCGNSGGGMEGIMPLILILCLCGGF